MTPLAKLVLRHRRLVGLFWVAVAVVGIALVGPISGRLTTSASFPGLPSFTAGKAIVHAYGNGGNNNPIVFGLDLPAGQPATSPAGRQDLVRTVSALAARPGLRVVDLTNTDDPKLIANRGQATYGLVFSDGNWAASQVQSLLSAHAPPGVRVHATGLQDLYSSGGGGGLGVLGELLIGAVGALAVLVVVFGSFLAVVPLLMAGVAILGTFLLIGLVTEVTSVSQIVEYLVALIGLGVAIDYSLLVVTRWREERERGCSNEQAVVTAMATAGRAVVFSGVTVGLGLLSLVALPIGFLRSMGYGGLLIPLVTVLAALTLLPVLLAAWGPALDKRSRRARRRAERRAGRPSRAWTGWARLVVRQRIVAAAVGLGLLTVLVVSALGIHVGEINPSAVSSTDPAAVSLRALEADGIPSGVIDPLEILVPAGADASDLARQLDTIPGVDTTLAPTGTAWHRAGSSVIDVLPVGPTSTTSGNTTTADVRAMVHRLAPGAQVAGDEAVESDMIHAYYGRFPLIVLLVALISLVALTRAFRSIVLPIKAVALNVLSVAAAYGAMVLIWQDGYGSKAIWGIPANGVVEDFVPLLLFAFLFGLSMDYEVFILSRIKEAHDRGLSTDDAVVEGMGHTGRLVTSAALILFLAFASLGAGPDVPVKVFATGMGLGVLLDATVVRALLVPALVALLGDRNWWFPGRRTSEILEVTDLTPPLVAAGRR